MKRNEKDLKNFETKQLQIFSLPPSPSESQLFFLLVSAFWY